MLKEEYLIVVWCFVMKWIAYLNFPKGVDDVFCFCVNFVPFPEILPEIIDVQVLLLHHLPNICIVINEANLAILVLVISNLILQPNGKVFLIVTIFHGYDISWLDKLIFVFFYKLPLRFVIDVGGNF